MARSKYRGGCFGGAVMMGRNIAKKRCINQRAWRKIEVVSAITETLKEDADKAVVETAAQFW